MAELIVPLILQVCYTFIWVVSLHVQQHVLPALSISSGVNNLSGTFKFSFESLFRFSIMIVFSLFFKPLDIGFFTFPKIVKFSDRLCFAY